MNPIDEQLLLMDIQAKGAEIARLEAENERMREALADLITAYVSNVDACRTAGFYSDPNDDEEIIVARAALTTGGE